MRLVGVQLRDVRRFTAPVRVDGFGYGVNVLAAPNESGKSTLFDALVALFFVPHRSRGKEVAALRPHAGGAPEVAAEIEIDGARYTVSKRWFLRPEARIADAHRLIAQADEAEAWIAARFGTDPHAGPAGFLWVGQANFSLEPDAPKDRGQALSTRRDLMQSVAGEVERITGGKRMDAALARVAAELAPYVTATGKVRAKGPLRETLDRIDALEGLQADLGQRASELTEAVETRRRLRRELEEVADPEAVEERRARLDGAKRALQSAERQADAVSRLTETLAYAELSLNTAEDELSRLTKARGDLAGMVERLAEAEARAAETAAAAGEAEASRKACAEAADRTAADARRADLDLRRAGQRDRVRRDVARRGALAERIEAAETAHQTAQDLAAASGAGPDEADMERIEALAQERDAALAVSRASAPRVTVRYAATGQGSVRLDGTALEEAAELPVHAPITLDIPGIGWIDVTPGRGTGENAVARTGAALDAALSHLGAVDLAAAREAARQRREAGRERQARLDRLRLLAPEGLDELRAEFAALPEMPPDEDGPPLAEAERAADAARGAYEAAEAALGRARAEAEARRMDAARAEVSRDALRERHAAATAALPRTDEATATETRTRAAATVEETRDRLHALQGEAPDLTAARAAHDRAQSAAEEADRRSHRLREDIARLDERIALRSGEAVAEELADCTAQLEEARARRSVIEHEIAVLTRLKDALESARNASRERYLAPVLTELAPLLRLLWPEARIAFDDETLLPTTLTRPGSGEEAIDILSGGTREQVAMLVRLAFARMLARTGQPVPVILDDALAYTDDDRIETMFTVLHRQAADLQIVVLTCRQRAFRALGGTSVEFKEEALPGLSSPARS